MWDTEKAWDHNVFRCCDPNLSAWLTQNLQAQNYNHELSIQDGTESLGALTDSSCILKQYIEK